MYGSSLKLFLKNPTGNDRIHGEYRPHLALGAYESEWGNSPEQARLVREFMLGIGEVISGVLCATVSHGALGYIAGTAAFDGATRIYNSLNSLWALHQTELTALQEWEKTALRPAISQ